MTPTALTSRCALCTIAAVIAATALTLGVIATAARPGTSDRTSASPAAAMPAPAAVAPKKAPPIAPEPAVAATPAPGCVIPGTVAFSPARLVRSSRGSTRRTWSYGWPVKPFDRQHPVRGFMNDPRETFHFGIDIAVPDGTPVYAVAAGTATLRTDDVGMVRVVEISTHGSSLFSYWHIVPAVRQGQHVAFHQVVGYVAKGWGHVHFGERDGVYYINPFHEGGLGPYADHTAPTVDEIGLDGGSLVVSAHDTPDPRVEGAWADEPVTPGHLRFRVISASGAASPWREAFDFRAYQLLPYRFTQVYTPRTRPNKPGRPGRYCFAIAPGTLAQDGSVVEVAVSDTSGNTAVFASVVSAAPAW